jgi:hypothetical protein
MHYLALRKESFSFCLDLYLYNTDPIAQWNRKLFSANLTKTTTNLFNLILFN